MGTCLGIRHRGRLIAMAGERLRLPGWTETSAVCTELAHRGRGPTTRLVRAVAAGIRERGDVPFLHAAADSARAIRLYESIGFTLRRRSPIVQVRSFGNTAREPAVATEDEMRSAPHARPAEPRRTEVADMTRVVRPRALKPNRSVVLHSRPHIDLQRVAGALCCS
ncbi:GNAT family N-acetyltransferase [Streptomyces sp. NPDC054834]